MWAFLGKLLLLGCARKVARRATATLETAAVAAVVAERLLAAQHRPAGGLLASHGPVLKVAHFLFVPAALIKGVRLTRRLAGKRRKPALPEVPSPSPAPLLGLGQDPLSPPHPGTKLIFPPIPGGPMPRAQWGMVHVPEATHTYAAWIRLLSQVLEKQHGVRSLPPDFDVDGCELARHLLYSGLLGVHKPTDGARCVVATAQRVVGSMAWRAGYPFMDARELEAWQDVAWWVGPDENGTMWMHLHLAHATEAYAAGQGRLCGRAVLSTLDLGLHAMGATHMRTATGCAPADQAPATVAAAAAGEGAAVAAAAAAVSPPPPPPVRGIGGSACSGSVVPLEPAEPQLATDDRIRVVIVGRGSNVRQALRIVPLMREFSHLVGRHYPGRLRSMHLVDLPRTARVSAAAFLSLVSQETRQKIKICKTMDLPDGIAAALLARCEASNSSSAAGGAGAQLQRKGRRAAAVASGNSQARLVAAAAAAGTLGGAAALHLQPVSQAALRAWAVRVVMALLMSVVAGALIFAQHLLGPSAGHLLRAFVDR